jgi:hypothetical protein
VKVCLNKRVIGTDRHLVQDRDTGEFTWLDHKPEDAWMFGDSGTHVRSLDALCESLRLDVKFSPGDMHISSWRLLGKENPNDVMWSHALPPELFQKCVSSLLDQLWCVLSEVNDTYYTSEFLVARSLIQSMARAKIDRFSFNRLIKSQGAKSMLGNLKSFEPMSDGKSQKILYNNSSSTTGRLTVKSGPSILTLRKDMRRVIGSRYDDGVVVQVDFTSLEPRVLLLLQGSHAPDDIYQNILETVLENSTTRDVAKSATLGAIFGISARRFHQTSGIDYEESKKILREVRRYFKISKFGKDLREKYFKDRCVENIYGRKIFPSSSESHVLVNNMVQSSGVDVALVGFSTLSETLRENNVEFSPLFLIHDAIVIDIPKKSYKKLCSIVAQGVYNDKLQATFPLSIEEIK